MIPTTPAEIGRRIKAERERLGLTQAQAAQASGIHRSTYSMLELAANPTLATLAALQAAGFEVRKIVPELLA